MGSDYNSQLDSNVTQLEYSPPPPGSLTEITNIGNTATVVTSINGTTGNITLVGGSTGYTYTGAGGTVTLSVSNAGTVRSSISAAESGVNTDITQLNGASQVDVSGSYKISGNTVVTASEVDISSDYKVSGTQVVTSQQAAIADASGGAVIDVEARAALNTLLAELRTHGLIDT